MINKIMSILPSLPSPFSPWSLASICWNYMPPLHLYMLGFYVDAEALNFDPHAHVAYDLSTEPFPQRPPHTVPYVSYITPLTRPL